MTKQKLIAALIARSEASGLSGAEVAQRSGLTERSVRNALGPQGNPQMSSLLDFIDALGLERPALVGHDWGARAVANACGLRPGVASALALLSVGYGTNAPGQPMPLEQARNYWYHWYMATPRGSTASRPTSCACACATAPSPRG